MWTFTLQVTCMTSCHSWLLPCEESSPGWVSWSLFLRDALCSFGAIIFLSSPCEWSLGLPAGLLEQLMTCVCCPSFNLIKICHQIAPEGEDGRVCSLGPDWPQPLAKLPEALTEASLGLGQWDGFVTVLLPQGWRAQQCLAWPRHSMRSPQRSVLQECLKPQSEFNVTVPIDLQLKSAGTPEL